MSAGLIEVRVALRSHEAEDICSYELVRADGTALPAFSAGAHIDVHVQPGIVRQYSLCNAPAETHRYLIAVLRDPRSRGGSQAMHDAVLAGQSLQISAPKNHFPLVPAKRSLLLAGGIGITPLLAMAEALAAQGEDFELHYCARSPARMAFAERIRQSAFAARVSLYYDAIQGLDLAKLLARQDGATHLYFCGPQGFLEHVQATAAGMAWPASQLHCEYFGAALTPQAGQQPFLIKLASSGAVYPVPPECSALQVLRDAGVFVPASCEQGVCGTCLTRVLDGIPDHRDLYQTEEEQQANDAFAPCCSRSKSGMLVLDL